MNQYAQYLEAIKGSSFTAPAARKNMPPTRVTPNLEMQFYFQDGFPILTGKKMPFYSILGELICFIQGRTDVRDFEHFGCGVWWDNAYRWNIEDKGIATISKEEYKTIGMENYVIDLGYTNKVINGITVSYNLGRIYSAQWRNSPSPNARKRVDQLHTMVNGMQHSPFSRYHVLDAWQPAEMTGEYTSQPNCHVYFQATIVEPNFNVKNDIIFDIFDIKTATKVYELLGDKPNCLFTHLTQRSCDAFLGVPFNITSYSLFTVLLALWSKTLPIQFQWVGVNNHIYSNHVDQVDQYLNASTYELPKLKLDIDAIDSFEKVCAIKTKAELRNFFTLVNYISGDKISAELSVG